MSRVLLKAAAACLGYLLLLAGEGLLPGGMTAMAAAPVALSTVSPNAGPNSGGTVVTLSGSGFEMGVGVKFGSVGGTILSASTTQISVRTPAEPGYPHTVDVSVLNPDGGVATLPGAFSFYNALPAGQLASAAAPVIFYSTAQSGSFQVFGRGTDNALYHSWQIDDNDHWSSWEYLGGGLTSAPAVVSWSVGRLDVFVRGNDNALWHRWYQAGGGWSGWESLGGGLRSAPAAASWGSGRLDVFVRGTDDQLWHKWYQAGAGWSGYEPLGGALTADPAATALPEIQRIDVFVRGSDDGLWQKSWSQGWSSYRPLGGNLTSGPSASTNNPGASYAVLALGASATLYYLPYQSVWKAWRPVGQYWSGSWAYGPGSVQSGFYLLGVDVFEVGGDGSVWHGNLPHPSVVSSPTRSSASTAATGRNRR